MSDDLRDRLRAGDPAHDLPPADPSRVSGLLQDVMATELTTENRETGTRDRSRLTWLVAAAAVVVIAAAATFAVRSLSGDSAPVASPSPSVSSSPSAGPSDTGATRLEAPAAAAYSARCQVPTPEALATADVAFDGTVTAMSGDRVTLRVNHRYAGDPTDSVEVTAPDGQLGRLVTTVDLVQDGRYLISAVDGQLSVCGFSGPYDRELVALFSAAFAG